jgi:AcrR family transcriptional regulator
MMENKASNRTRERGEPACERVIDAAERLLRDGKADFSMRDLAAEAAVSFATPFNQFGSKGGIMHALSERRTTVMAARFTAALQPTDALSRVMLAVETAVAVMLEEPAVNRAVMGWIGTGGGTPGQAWARSNAFWTLALGKGEGIPDDRRELAMERLPKQLALAFRGTLSFWTAGELSDKALGPEANAIALTLLLSFTEWPSSSCKSA